MGRGKVTIQTKVQIKSLFENGFGQREIVRRLNISQKCVFGVVHKVKKNLPIKDLAGQGRKKATTEAEDRYLLRIMKEDRTKSS